MRTPTFEKKYQPQFSSSSSSSFSAVFVGNSVSRCRLSRTTSESAQKSGNIHYAKIAFFMFFRRKNWHDFVTPFSTFANNIKGSLPTKSTTSDRLRCRARQSDEDFTVLKEEKHKKSFFFRARYPI
jgi:hypothetical protein|tara:strand:+ start:820 stop:1197 length:378 start_codon:yes stop_codon:yes gene_type:complete